jgi:diaminopimelate epimerase
MVFKTDAGPIEAEMRGEQVKLKMTPPLDCRIDFAISVKGEKRVLSSINTGVPHVVLEQTGLSDADIVSLGRAIRYHDAFAPAGTNVNFVLPAEGGRLQVRTYERGVEDETLACGTGCVASALITAARRGWSSPIPVTTRSGGILTIHFQQAGRQFREVYLEGDARIVYRGDIQPDALMA